MATAFLAESLAEPLEATQTEAAEEATKIRRPYQAIGRGSSKTWCTDTLTTVSEFTRYKSGPNRW